MSGCGGWPRPSYANDTSGGAFRPPHVPSKSLMTTEERYDLARQIINEIAASGTCTDHIDVHVRAKGRGFDLEVDRLLQQKIVRDEVDAMCAKARRKPA